MAILRWHEIAPIKVATIAPEIDKAGVLADVLNGQNCLVQIGHSLASYAQAKAALDAGYAGFTHLFNAMTSMHHRHPGIAGCALAHARHAELILDFHHVSPGAAKAALRAIPELYVITDAGAAAGMPDGDYRLGIQEVKKCGSQVLLADGTIAGSALTMDQAFRNLLLLGLDVIQASRRCATIQAAYLGLSDRGSLVRGKRSDIVVLDADFHVVEVFKQGNLLTRL